MKKTIQHAYSLSQYVIVTAFLLTVGCGEKTPQGKYTQDEMLDIPLADRYQLPEPTGGMVYSVGGETLTPEEVLAPIRGNLAPVAEKLEKSQFIEQALPWVRKVIKDKVLDLLLYQEARKKAPENIDDALEDAVKKEMSRFVAGYDNNIALAEQHLKQQGLDWRSFRDLQKKMILTQSYISADFKEEKKYTRLELLDYYNRIKDEQFSRPGRIEFRLIEIVPSKVKAEQILEGETSAESALRIAEELLVRINQGEDFGQLAGQYSHGPLASQGGLWMPVTIGANSLTKPYDVLEQKAIQLEAGQIAGPFEHGGRIFILRLENKQPEESKSFEEVIPVLQTQLRFQFQSIKYKELMDRMLNRADLVEMDRFAIFCTELAWKQWSRNSNP